jgi:hypothetical protein
VAVRFESVGKCGRPECGPKILHSQAFEIHCFDLKYMATKVKNAKAATSLAAKSGLPGSAGGSPADHIRTL